jgi:hypothetical protein
LITNKGKQIKDVFIPTQSSIQMNKTTTLSVNPKPRAYKFWLQIWSISPGKRSGCCSRSKRENLQKFGERNSRKNIQRNISSVPKACEPFPPHYLLNPMPTFPKP